MERLGHGLADAAAAARDDDHLVLNVHVRVSRVMICKTDINVTDWAQLLQRGSDGVDPAR